MGFTQFQQVLPSFTGFYLVSIDFTQFYWVLPSFNRFYLVSFWVFMGFTQFHQVLPSFTGFYLVSIGFTQFYWVLLFFLVFYGFYLVSIGLTKFYRVLPSFNSFYLVLPGFTQFQQLLPSFTGFQLVLLGFAQFCYYFFINFYPFYFSNAVILSFRVLPRVTLGFTGLCQFLPVFYWFSLVLLGLAHNSILSNLTGTSSLTCFLPSFTGFRLVQPMFPFCFAMFWHSSSNCFV